MNNKKVVLLIMDGWGLAKADKYNAIDNASTPNFDKLIKKFPNTRLKSDGLSVGLPEGQFGTSEVNHLTIGSGRIILQDLPRINSAIKNEEFFKNLEINKTITHVKENNSNLHLIGIISDGGVHSHINHLFALFDLIEKRNLDNKIYLHLFTDGRDVPPKSAEKYFTQLEEKINKLNNLKIFIATIQGRSYLDRDRDWDRTEKAFKLLNKGKGIFNDNWRNILQTCYKKYNSDEQFPQYLLNKNGLIKENDGIIFFHYRTDRMYQIIRRLLDEKLKNLSITTFIQISEEFDQINVAFPRIKVDNTLAEIIALHDLKQLHVTETEKFAHLTFFLNGEKEKEFAGEDWKMIESNRFIKPYYNFEPSMRNFDVTKIILQSIQKSEHDFIIANFSSPDMVGHTGNYHSAVVSAESVDYCIGKIYESLENKLDEYALIITADHGNSDIMWDYENNQPHTQHTNSLVPFILISSETLRLHNRESLADIAPTVLDLMGISKPDIMTGESLIISNKI